MNKVAPAHYTEKLTPLNERYYCETWLNKGYYFRACSDVAEAGIKLIIKNFNTHDYKHAGDRVVVTTIPATLRVQSNYFHIL